MGMDMGSRRRQCLAGEGSQLSTRLERGHLPQKPSPLRKATYGHKVDGDGTELRAAMCEEGADAAEAAPSRRLVKGPPAAAAWGASHLKGVREGERW